MNTMKAINLAGGGTTGRKALAALLGVSSITTYKWEPDIPDRHVWRLQVLKPEWFDNKPKVRKS